MPKFIETGYRGLWGNDEMFYDGPDFEIPTIGLGRGKWPHYHTDLDDLEHCNFRQLTESLRVLERIADVFEQDCIPTRQYRGPLYQSRYGVHVDIRHDRKHYFALQDLQRLMDGSRSCLECADRLDIPFDFVLSYVRQLQSHGLVKVRSTPIG